MFILNQGQRKIVNLAKSWYKNSSEQIFQISGNPGTGKSVVLNTIISELGLKITEVAPMSYTGAAAIVMRTKGLTNAKTIHSWLYEVIEEPMVGKDGLPIMDTYLNKPKYKRRFVPKDLYNIKLIVIDEAGMVPYSMKEDLLKRGIKILVAGDLDQLDPVADRPAFLYEGKVHVLTEIMRQAEGSAIIYLSQRAKLGLPLDIGYYNNAMVIRKSDLTNDLVLAANVVLCGKNATRDKLNKFIREELFNRRSTLPVRGDKMICRKNNWSISEGDINLANGLAGTIINSPDVSGFNGKTYTINFLPNMSNDVFKELECDYEYLIADHSMKALLKEDRYSRGEKFEYGYTLTTHLSQGSQYYNGIYIEEFLNRDINNKLNYTAITRFSNRLIYVKPDPKFYVK